MKTLLYLIPCLWAVVVGVEVQTDSGRVVGKQAEYHGLYKNGSYFSFHGIPYATPPVGSLRFHDPIPISPWSDDLDASGGPPAVCPQLEFFNQQKFGQIVGDESCLFLNIYSPEVPSHGSELRPVIFWIHGGGFVMGSGANELLGGSGEDLLIEKDMVVVTINYRLGIFGFMAMKGTTIQGNMGLKDQLVAMRWVKRNIAAFGGDPSRITIMGESAGGISVHEQVLSPMGKGEDLFHRAISMSGTALMIPKEKFGRFTEESSRRAFEILCNANLTTSRLPRNLTETCLYSLPALEISSQMNEAFIKMMNASIEEQLQVEDLMTFAPIIDDWAGHPFIPHHPVTVLSNQKQKMVPFMSGITSDEGAMFVAPLWKDMDPKNNKLKSNWETFGPWKFFAELDPTKINWNQKVFANMVARFYVGENGLTRENKQALIDMFSDFMFASPNTETIKLHAKSDPPVYNYRFSYTGGSFSLANLFSMGDKNALKEDFGVCHGDDLLYTFRFPFPALVTDQDIKMADTFLTLLTSFARYGDPTPFAKPSTKDNIPDGHIPKWNPAQNSKRACIYMDINEQPSEKHNMYPVRMEFWNKIYFQNVLKKYDIHHEDHNDHHRDHDDHRGDHDDHHGDHNDHHGDHNDHHEDHNDHHEEHNDHHGDHNNHHEDHNGHHGNHSDHQVDHNDHDGDHDDHDGDHNDHHENHNDHHGDHNDHHKDHNDHHGDHNDHHGDHIDHHEDHNGHHGNHSDHHVDHNDHDGDHDDQDGDHNDHHEDHNDHHGDHNDHHGDHNDHHEDHNDHHGDHKDHHGDHIDHHGDHYNEHAGHGDQVHYRKESNCHRSGH